ncbi:MAG: hypothetical protein ACOYH4_03635 [Saccharofermentanales bacterium]|jgi:hypothetical protein
MKRRRAWPGGLSLEAVIVFPLILIVLFVMLGAVRAERDAMILAHALDQTADEIALLLPMADLAEAFGDPDDWLQKHMPDPTLRAVTLNATADVAATVLASPWILERVDYWATETARGLRVAVPVGARKLAVDVDEAHQSIWLILSFERTAPVPAGWSTVRSRVPIWNARLFSSDEDPDDEDETNVWDMSNFDRGRAIRARFGGHLPPFYPVIAMWDGRQATSIKSMDWTAPTYADPGAVERKLMHFVDDLAAFEGVGGEGPAPGTIRSRRLVLVIPDNAIAWKTSAILSRWRSMASARGVTLDIRTYQTSHRYETHPSEMHVSP